jgi:hypothetical protein
VHIGPGFYDEAGETETHTTADRRCGIFRDARHFYVAFRQALFPMLPQLNELLVASCVALGLNLLFFYLILGINRKAAFFLHIVLFPAIDGEQNDIKNAISNMITVFTVKRSKHKVRLPQKVDEKIAYLIGLIIGDDHLAGYEEMVNGAWRIYFCNGNEYFIKHVYVPIITDLFGVEPTAKEVIRTDGRRYFEVSFASKVIHRLLTDIFELPTRAKCDKVKMPQILKSSADEVRASFLRGLFDTDGSVVNAELKFTTTSRRLCEDVSAELENFGFSPKVYEWTKNEKCLKLFEIRLCRRNDVQRFCTLVRPLHPEKMRKLSLLEKTRI